MGMEVRIVRDSTTRTDGDRDYVRVSATTAPEDDTVTLATIERVVARTIASEDKGWRVKTLIHNKPMSLDAAVGLATCYARRKNIPVVYTERK